jgi:hypothetical protein
MPLTPVGGFAFDPFEEAPRLLACAYDGEKVSCHRAIVCPPKAELPKMEGAFRNDAPPFGGANSLSAGEINTTFASKGGTTFAACCWVHIGGVDASLAKNVVPFGPPLEGSRTILGGAGAGVLAFPAELATNRTGPFAVAESRRRSSQTSDR